jgi:DNA mismatch repair protein MutL
MSKIRVLPDTLANKIAAGEVVERPASVVKELLENALDAGAGKINIEVEAGGKRLIRIIDDGEGMTRDDAIIAFERHATSKLRTAADLEFITTLGFRGEALPSIAAVSKLFLRTKTASDVEGTEVEFNGGKLVNVRDIAWPGGTEIEVKELFFNMPARRKFLKSDATESFHITNLVQHYALANHQLALLLINNARDSIRVPAVQSLKERAYQILGGPLLNKLLEVDSQANGLKIIGYVSNPQEQRSSKDAQYLFVNRRFVKDQLISRAVSESYRSMMPSGTYPAAVLFIEVPPDEVDVNVHPAKTEVRFLHESTIFAFVRDSIAQALKSTDTITRLPGTAGGIRVAPERFRSDAPRWQNIPTWSQNSFNPVEALPSVAKSTTVSNPVPAGQTEADSPPTQGPAREVLGAESESARRATLEPTAAMNPGSDSWPSAEERRALLEDLHTNVASPAEAQRASATESQSRLAATEEGIAQPDIAAEPTAGQAFVGEQAAAAELAVSQRATEPQGAGLREESSVSFWHGIKPMGQIRDSYIVATDDEGLLIFDQHVVHERILFEQIRDGRMSRVNQIQPLLIPETLDLSPAESEAFQVVKDELEHLGIETMELSGRTIAIKTAPAGIASKDVVAIVQQLLSAVERERRSFTIETIRDEIAASMACKAAIKVNMALTEEKMQWLINELMKTQNPMTCPHGRPIIMRFDLRDIERGFKRPV